jgi:ATP phosphoribosyltransferase regulatory subunit
MRDMLFGECAARRAQSADLAALFGRRNFLEVSTPVLERYELFTRTGSPISEETMVKVIGPDGRIYVLRPDNTAPIARLAASRLQNEPLPLKLWYAQPVFRHGGGEVSQAGAEIIGAFDDYEAILLAREAAELIHPPLHIEVSHAGILRAVFTHFSLNEAQIEDALSLIGRKNFAALGDSYPGGLLKLVRLSGGIDALDEAAKISPVSIDGPLGELRALLKKQDTLTVDFGLAPSLGYYTGVFFKGYAGGASGAVLSGGRYDNLLGLLGKEAPAIGFAIFL